MPQRSSFFLVTSIAFWIACPPQLVFCQEKPAAKAVGESKYFQHAQQCIDTLLEHGLDRYGDQHSPLLMAVIDTRDLKSPRNPKVLDSLVRLEERLHRRAERGSNLWYDQATLRAMYYLSQKLNDKKYQNAADAYVGYFYKHCRKPLDESKKYANGLPAWGSHVYWDCFADQPAGDGDGIGPHEPLLYQAEWARMARVSPKQVQWHVDQIWRWHIVDKQTGQHNRHDDGNRGCDFAFAGGSFMHAFAALHKTTGEREWLRRAKLVADWHWSQRNKTTGLVADAPDLSGRYDGQHCFTTIVGPHSASLLRCFELTMDKEFRQMASAYIKAYDRYGWDPKKKSYWAMIRLDGIPVKEKAKGQGYDAWAPYGHVNVWRTSIFSYEFTLSAAQTSIYAYELSGNDGQRDPELLSIAKRWAQVIEQDLPPKTGRRWKAELEKAFPESKKTGGAYAEDYGRAISFFVHLYRASGEPRYLRTARQLGDEAIEKLFVNGLFKGHPAKPYYETTNGVGLLLWSLLELDSPNRDLDDSKRGAF